MEPADSDDRRESTLLGETVDPIARELLGTDDAWDAYEAAMGVSGILVDELSGMPYGGQLYVAWSGLTDLYATGKTPIVDAHEALRQASKDWLERPGPPGGPFVEKWLERTTEVVNRLFARDGDFWRP
jgi:hypothetical protein